MGATVWLSHWTGVADMPGEMPSCFLSANTLSTFVFGLHHLDTPGTAMYRQRSSYPTGFTPMPWSVSLGWTVIHAHHCSKFVSVTHSSADLQCFDMSYH